MARVDRQPRPEDCTPKQWADFSELCRYLQSLNLPQRLTDKKKAEAEQVSPRV